MKRQSLLEIMILGSPNHLTVWSKWSLAASSAVNSLLEGFTSPIYSHGSPMDSDGFHQTPMGLFFGMGLSIVCLSYWTFFPLVLSKTHQTPLESCIGL